METFPAVVLFDCDGVLADNEREGHQVAFNAAFEERGLAFQWDDTTYRKLVEVGGGKERLRYFFNSTQWPVKESDRDDFIRELHRTKTRIYVDLVRAGKINIRPGVAEFIHMLIEKKIPYGICSTSNEKAVSSLVKVLFDKTMQTHLKLLLAGDAVANKKPDPEIYLKAAKHFRVSPENCLVIEDSNVGLRAAKSAGMKVLITQSFYTAGDDFSAADFVTKSLDESGITSENFLAKLRNFR